MGAFKDYLKEEGKGWQNNKILGILQLICKLPKSVYVLSPKLSTNENLSYPPL